jgi:hypothetical protein
MKNVFVFCASERKARVNFCKTILNPIAEAEVLDCFPTEKHAELLAWQEEAGGFYAWGIRPGKRVLTMLSAIQAGDCVLGFFDFRYQTASQLVGKAENSTFAERMWGGNDWSRIIFITKPREMSVPASNCVPYLCSTYRGATRIGARRIEKMVKDFGTVQEFIGKTFGSLNEAKQIRS